MSHHGSQKEGKGSVKSELENGEMESGSRSSDLLGTVVRPPSIRVARSFSLSGRLTPRSSPSFKRSPSMKTPARSDSRVLPALPWYRKLLRRNMALRFLAISIWACIGLLILSRWDRDVDKDAFIETETEEVENNAISAGNTSIHSSLLLESSHSKIKEFEHSVRNEEMQMTRQRPNSWVFPSFGVVNSTVGTFVGPFDEIEKQYLQPVLKQHVSSCENDGAFREFVWRRSFMLIFHELSMTGSPLSMMELAMEILRCGGKVTAVAQNQKGGLLQELLFRGIKVLKNKDTGAFKIARKVDLIVAGSAVCASWIADLVQLKLWQSWTVSENITLPGIIKVIPLSVNEELALKAGCYMSTEDIKGKMQQLRDIVRSKMGLLKNDMLLTTLSSINPAKGQLKIIQALAMVVNGSIKPSKVERMGLMNNVGHQRVKLLLGSVGSKSNKIDYIQKLLTFISEHPYLAELILWTPATVHVSTLYAASDVYVMNAQGLGETFGRVTLEAMAFALPILGTDMGGTVEIVEDKANGLLHQIGSDGVTALAENIRVLLKNESLRLNMGLQGKQKVKKMYLKQTMYESLAQAFSECLYKNRTSFMM